MTIREREELGCIIDRACDTGNEQELLLIIAINSEYVETISDSVEKATLYYFLANAWSGLRHIRHQNKEHLIWSYEQDEVNNEIIYLRKAKAEKGFAELPVEYQYSILTNLANIFDHAGRIVYALSLYNRAINVESRFVMAVCNRGRSLSYYANLDYDTGHKLYFKKIAYDELLKASANLDLYIQNGHDAEYYKNVKQGCEDEIKNIKHLLGEENLLTDIELNNFSTGKAKEEQKYRKWALENTLFLNPMNDLGAHNIAAHDPLVLPDLTTGINVGFPKYITYFNQIKQEYVAYRHLLYEGVFEKTNKFYDSDTVLIDDYDYNLHSIDIEKMKAAFRGFYSIFDKIAYFLNEYFNLGWDSSGIDFRKIWKNKNNQKELNSKFNGLDNLALRGLYFVGKDLFFPNGEDKLFISVVEPEAEEINEIRNHLEHKFINIKLLDVDKYNTFDKREKVKYITLGELTDKTIHVAKLAREAMIYLSFAVHIEESKKNTDELYVSIMLDTLKK